MGATVETMALTRGTHGGQLPVRSLGTRRFGLRTLKELRRAASSFDVVVAHGSSTLPASVLGLIGTGLPVVYRQISDPEVWAASWSRRLRSAALLRRMSAVVALSAGFSTTLQRHYWLRSRPTVTVIPNAVPEERFRPPGAGARARARTALGVPVDAVVLLFIGALASEKGVDVAIEVAAELPTAVLLIVGDGPQRAELEELASRRMPQRCFFVGSLDDPQPAYWSADVLVFPSLSEAMPAVLIEAGLSGLASVATDVGAIREVIDEGRTGLVVPSGDAEALAAAVSALMSDHSRRSAMGIAAAERCSRHFTMSHIASAWLDLLSSVASRGNP